VGGKPVPAWFIKETFQKHSRKPILNRFIEVVRDIVNNVFTDYRYEVMGKERTQLHTTIRKMFPCKKTILGASSPKKSGKILK